MNEWIPVSERLPNDRDWYLAIFKEADTGWVNPLPFVSDYLGSKTKATTNEGWIIHNCTDCDVVNEYYRNLECVAWMPLPEPYKDYIKDCLSCANSFSEEGDENGDFLHCSLKDWALVEEDGYCDDWNA